MAAPLQEPKYRVTFTEVQLQYLHHMMHPDALTTTPLNITSKEIRELDAYLQLTLLKIKMGTVSVSHVATAKQSLAEKLGVESAEDSDTKANRLARCYNKYTHTPSLCTPAERDWALEYMYLNNMLTPEQEAEYEETSNVQGA